MLLKIIVLQSLIIGAFAAEEVPIIKPKPITTTTSTTPIYTTGTRTKPTITTTTTVVYTTETTPIPTTSTTTTTPVNTTPTAKTTISTTPYQGTGSTIRWTTTFAPTTPPQPTAPICCAGPNQIYLPPGIAPYCQVYCEDITKKCHRRYDILEPYGCYCIPGYCLAEDGITCVAFSKIFKDCY